MTLPARKEDGYVLISALVMLAIAGLLAAGSAQRVSRLAEHVAWLDARTQTERAYAETLSAVTFDIYTTAAAPCGLTPGRSLVDDPFAVSFEGAECEPLDGRWRDGADAVRVSVIDNASLMSVNAAGAGLTALAEQAAGSAASGREMVQSLRDYVDGDEISGVFGSERRPYQLARLAPPRNAPMVTPYEATRVVGWRDRLPPDAYDLLGIHPSGAIAVNTAPPAVLSLSFGLEADEVGAVLGARQRDGGLANPQAFEEAIGRAPDYDPFSASFGLSDYYRIRMTGPAGPALEVLVAAASAEVEYSEAAGALATRADSRQWSVLYMMPLALEPADG